MRKISRRNFLLASGAVTISVALSACGGSSSSTGAASSAAASSAASDAPAAQGKVLNIWCWNDEFQGRFNNYYPEVASIAEDKSTTTLKDGTVVKWTINANENNNYQNKLDEALLNQDSAADDDKVDIFLIEADYALKYVDSDYALDVKADIGLTDADLAGQYQYTKDIVSVDGSQRGTTWQATPGLFAYRRSIAKDVLGTDDPTEVQSHLSDWDKFNEVAAQAYAKGYKMLSGFDDAYRTFSNNVDAPWVDGTTVKVDPNIMKWVDQTKEYTDKGYNNKSSLWEPASGQPIRARAARCSGSSIPPGASISRCWVIPWKRPRPRAAKPKRATASTAITPSAKARSRITGAAHGSAPRPAPIIPISSAT